MSFLRVLNLLNLSCWVNKSMQISGEGERERGREGEREKRERRGREKKWITMVVYA